MYFGMPPVKVHNVAKLMRTPTLRRRTDAAPRDPERGVRLIRKIEARYGLPSRYTPAALAAESGLNGDQMLVNEALVAKIFQCERAETALRISQQNLHKLLIHQLQLKEEERKRISMEIHDALGQNLMALRLDIAALSQVTGDRHPRLQAWVRSSLDNIDSAIVTVRTLIAALRPFEIELGVEAAVQHELSQFRRTSGIACHLSMDDRVSDLHLTDEQTLTIYRALQEFLSNIARHSRATRVDVVLRAMTSVLTMAVSDNGVGLRRGSPRKPGGYGLQAVRERVGSLGGKVALKSVRSNGTTVAVSIPLAAPRSTTAALLSDKMAT
jgi:signal transduction histidine kinase